MGRAGCAVRRTLKDSTFSLAIFYATGGDFLISALQKRGIQVTHLPSHEAAKDFPFELRKLQAFDVVILSDIGANTLLLPPETFMEGKRVPNRLERVKKYVMQGGGEGRSVAWTSDIGPHWCPKEFVDWPGYGEVWARIIQWLCKGDC